MAHADPCGEWNPALAVDLATGHASRAFTASWSAFANCGSFTNDNYKLCWDYETSTAPTTLGSVPTSPTLGECLENMDAIVLPSEGGGNSGAFFKARAEAADESTCFVSAQGIVFAELRN